MITADNLRTAATNLGINRAELLTRYRFIDPEEVTSLADEMGGRRVVAPPPAETTVATAPERRTKISELSVRPDAPPL